MDSTPISRGQNQVGAHPPQTADLLQKATTVVAAKDTQFKEESPFQRFINKIVEKAPSFVASLKAAQDKSDLQAGALPLPSSGKPDLGRPQTLETVFVDLFGKGSYPVLEGGAHAEYAPKTAKAWESFLNENLPRLGALIQDVKLKLGESVNRAIYRGLLESASSAFLIGDFFMNPENATGRNPRMAFLQVPLPTEALGMFNAMVPGQALTKEEIALLGEEVVAREIVSGKGTPEDGGEQALLRLKGGNSDGQLRFESAILARRETREIEENREERRVDRDSTFKPRSFFGGWPAPFFLWSRPEGMAVPQLGKKILYFWVGLFAVAAILYVLIRAF